MVTFTGEILKRKLHFLGSEWCLIFKLKEDIMEIAYFFLGFTTI